MGGGREEKRHRAERSWVAQSDGVRSGEQVGEPSLDVEWVWDGCGMGCVLVFF